MGEYEMHYLIQHIITLRQILAVNCGIQVEVYPSSLPDQRCASRSPVNSACPRLLFAGMRQSAVTEFRVELRF